MGNLTWPVIRAKVDGAIVVSEREIITAMQLCYERMKVCPAAVLADLHAHLVAESSCSHSQQQQQRSGPAVQYPGCYEPYLQGCMSGLSMRDSHTVAGFVPCAGLHEAA